MAIHFDGLRDEKDIPSVVMNCRGGYFGFLKRFDELLADAKSDTYRGLFDYYCSYVHDGHIEFFFSKDSAAMMFKMKHC